MNVHPELEPLLCQFGLTVEQFHRKGRLGSADRWIIEARRSVVTTLHLQGKTWAQMCLITGLSNGSIQRLTQGIWNEASRENSRQNAVRSGRLGKGVKKPWLTELLRVRWREGKFDNQRGRKLSEQQRQMLRASFTPERRASIALRFRRQWQDPEYRDPLLAYHRSPEERQRRSKRTAEWVAQLATRRQLGSIPGWYEPAKCSSYPVFTKSSYERVACDVLDALSEVFDYDYEPPLVAQDGRTFLPDFVVRRGTSTVLVEVKASWVLQMPPTDKRVQRLELARREAALRGWGFEIWTEKDRLRHALHARRNPKSL